jgi:hypothetical protein
VSYYYSYKKLNDQQVTAPTKEEASRDWADQEERRASGTNTRTRVERGGMVLTRPGEDEGGRGSLRPC